MDHRTKLLALLARYAQNAALEALELTTVRSLQDFVRDTPTCFERTTLAGHITASAWVTDPSDTRVVLMLHRKLARWLQPGGHADGDSDLERVARKEVREETGLDSLTLTSAGIFDIDIHQIPAQAQIPQHLHYDVRFAFRALQPEKFAGNDESLEITWTPISALSAANVDDSVLRMKRKWLRHIQGTSTI